MTSSADRTLLPTEGEIFGGKYKIEGTLGKGGMGIVVRALHMHLQEPVAIKILRPDILVRPESVARFVREARTTTKLQSKHVVRVLDVDMVGGTIPFIVMELLRGSDVASMLAKTGALPIETALHHVIEACDGVAAAHAAGIVHRDLKPANIFLTDEGTIKLLDFGVSKVADSTFDDVGNETEPSSERRLVLHAQKADASLTRTGAWLGSPKYMAPEQIRSPRDVDTRADIWAIGAILYEMLTGRPPFLATDAELLAESIQHKPPMRPRTLRPSIPLAIERVVLRCLEKKPDDRFQSILDVKDALIRATSRRWLWIAAASALIVLIVVAVFARPHNPVPQPAAISAPTETSPARIEPRPVVSSEVAPQKPPPTATASAVIRPQARATPSAALPTIPSAAPSASAKRIDRTHAFDDPE